MRTQLEIPRRRWEGNIQIDLKEQDEKVEWIVQAQSRSRRNESSGTIKTGYLLTISATDSFLRRILLHRVIYVLQLLCLVTKVI
jgi:hypothetical protein